MLKLILLWIRDLLMLESTGSGFSHLVIIQHPALRIQTAVGRSQPHFSSMCARERSSSYGRMEDGGELKSVCQQLPPRSVKEMSRRGNPLLSDLPLPNSASLTFPCPKMRLDDIDFLSSPRASMGDA